MPITKTFDEIVLFEWSYIFNGLKMRDNDRILREA